jgi:hypothetical protein
MVVIVLKHHLAIINAHVSPVTTGLIVSRL